MEYLGQSVFKLWLLTCLMQCERKKLKDLKKQFWSVPCFLTITGKVARISCSFRFLLNFFAVLQFQLIFLIVVQFPIDPIAPSLR